MLCNGYATSILGTLLVWEMARGHAYTASVLDFAVLTSAALGWQTWKERRFPFGLLLWEAAGSALGTFITLHLVAS